MGSSVAGKGKVTEGATHIPDMANTSLCLNGFGMDLFQCRKSDPLTSSNQGSASFISLLNRSNALAFVSFQST